MTDPECSTKKKKLDFDRLGHYHEKELHQLEVLCRRRQQLPASTGGGAAHPSGEFLFTTTSVIVEAESGTGKSALLDALCSELEKGGVPDNHCFRTVTTSACFYCRGKFEERAAASEPFAAIRDAMGGLFEGIISRNAAFDATCIRQTLGPDLGILMAVFPNLKTVLGVPDNTTTSVLDDKDDGNLATLDGFGNMTQMEWRFERLRFAFRALIRHAQEYGNVVLLLDDLHNADLDSMELIKTLILDSITFCQANGCFTFVGTSRPLEGYRHPRQLVEDVPDDALTVMGVWKLSTECIATICNTLMDGPGMSNNSPSQETMELAGCLREKSGGNAFVLLQHLRRLEQQELIYHAMDEGNIHEQQWKWIIDRIQEDVSKNENVNEIVANGIETLNTQTKSALIVAASFGVSHFDLATIIHAIPVVASSCLNQGEAKVEMPLADEFDSSDPYVVRQSMKLFGVELSKAVELGYIIELSPPGRFQWVHDRVREAAYSLIPEGRVRQEMHLEIGRQLRSFMDIQGELGATSGFSEEELLLHCMKQLNAGKTFMTDNWELLDLADLSFQAAEHAAQQLSFSSAMEYLQLGIDCLPPDSWRDHYDLTLKLHVALMRMQYSLTRLEDCVESAEDILEHARVFKEKRAAYHTILLSRLQQQRFGQGINFGLSVLDKELGIKIPQRCILPRAIVGYFKCARRFKTMSDKEIMSMPMTEDERTQDASELFMRIFELSFNGDDDFAAYGIFLGVKMIEYLFQDGPGPVTFVALVAFAQIAVFLDDFETSERSHMLGLAFLERGRKLYPSLAARWELLHGVSAPLGSHPVQDTVESMRRAMADMKELGALDYIFMDSMEYLRRCFVAGKPLGWVAQQCEKHCELLKDYKQNLQWINNAPLHQAVQNLRLKDVDDNVTELAGEHLNKADVPLDSSPMALYHYHFYTMVLCYHFNDYHSAKTMIKRLPKDISMSGVAFFVPTRILYTGLVYTGLCRTSQRQRFKYRSRAQSAMKHLRGWASKGVLSCEYMSYLLQAELLACPVVGKVNFSNVLGLYDKAIASVTELGILHHIALANELVGMFAWKHGGGGSGLAGSYMLEAQRYYAEWGSRAKVQDVQNRFGDVLNMKGKQSQLPSSLVRSVGTTVTVTQDEPSSTSSIRIQ